MQNRRLENLGKFFNSIFGSIWNSKSKNWKSDLKEKTLTLWWGLRRKIPISEVSKFSILPYTQNWKLRNLGKFSVTSIFGSIWNSKSKNWKNNPKEEERRFEKKKTHFWGFRVFNFALYLISKTWKPQKVFIYFKFLLFQLH